MTSAMVLEDTDWPSDAVATIIGLAHAHDTFTADDLCREMRKAPHPNMVGAAFSTARGQGLIEAAGYTTSNTPSRHHGVIRTWRRKIQGVRK
jgi:adenosine/AMP kinase